MSGEPHGVALVSGQEIKTGTAFQVDPLGVLRLEGEAKCPFASNIESQTVPNPIYGA